MGWFQVVQRDGVTLASDLDSEVFVVPRLRTLYGPSYGC